MNEDARDAFSEAILDRVAAIAWEEQRPHLTTYLNRTRSTRSTSTTPTHAGTAHVVSLDARRRARRVA